MTNEFRARLKRREKLIGTMVTLASASSAEVLASLGFDWLFVDAEHGPLETRELLGILQSVGDKAACIVRVPEAAELPIKKALDLGAHGIIVPQVNTAEQAADVVRWSRYAPEGARGVGLARAHGYGLKFREYLSAANREIAVIVQAEHARAVDNIDAIVRVPGVDAVLLGPYDLSASLGKMGQIDDPVVVAAIGRSISSSWRRFEALPRTQPGARPSARAASRGGDDCRRRRGSRCGSERRCSRNGSRSR